MPDQARMGGVIRVRSEEGSGGNVWLWGDVGAGAIGAGVSGLVAPALGMKVQDPGLERARASARRISMVGRWGSLSGRMERMRW